MKKYRYACIISFALLAVLLSACGGATVVKPLEEIRADIEAAVQLPAMLDLKGDDLMSFVGIPAEDYEEAVALVPEEAISGEMLFMFKAKDEAAADRIAKQVETYFTSAKNQMRDYIPSEYAKMEKGAVTKTGQYVWLAVSAEQDKVVEIIKANIK
jgi:hypothetical protein